MLTQQLETLIENLMRRHNVPILYPGEFGYKMLAARLIKKEVNHWLKSNGATPDVTVEIVRCWFYRKFPSWVIAVLNSGDK
ncbi:hypothetical protein PCC9214_05357 [Planktothrix tepida]|uniref:Uncharacterized protein n=1 Tax=Planktothrix tepida PCC 9214 TaxID=671072 RepID=A0A1J1LJQ7_9CYAN|nr:hypothetical protein [Planktothrix tepida]CAD5984934.1 hypothetical protein PCC9214_05319 [Planktothrix tepida]CAD5985208.1 hypothetical protein PCC9214_05357 [Planktothrix tepida]CUR32132.1 hypothetical protein PL9214430104 [Planktothrix tepida PCC 9214]